MLDGAARIGDVVATAVADGQPAHRASPITATCTASSTSTRSAATRASSRSSAPRPTWPTSAATSARPRGAGSTTRAATPRAARSSTTTSPCWPRPTTATSNLIQLASRGVPGGLLLQAPDRLGAAREHHEGLIATTGCLGGHVLQSLMNQGDESGAREGRPPAGHLRPGQPVRRDPGPRPPRPAPHQPQAARDRRSASARRSSPPTTATTCTGRRTWPTTPCCACRPGRS